MTRKLRKSLLLVAKIGIAAALLALLLSKVHWHNYSDHGQIRQGFVSIVGGVNWLLLAAAMAGFALSLLIVAARWRLLLRIQDIHISSWEAVRLTFLGQFFNAVVPGLIGGDLVKAYYVSKHTPRKAGVLVSIFTDRILGLTELTILSATTLAIVLASGGAERLDSLRTPAISIAVVSGLVALALIFLLSSGFRRVLRLQRLYRHLPIAKHISAVGDAVRLYQRRTGSLAKAVAITFGAHVLWIGSIWLIGLSLSLPMMWHHYFLYVPLIYIIGSVPITPGGVGLIEQFYLLFFSAWCDPGQVLALALLARLIPVLCGLPGAMVAITGPKLPKAEAIGLELGLEKEPAG